MARRAPLLGLWTALTLAAVAWPAHAQDEPIPQPEDVNDASVFDETLSPYGQWVDTGTGPDGGRAWRPDPDAVGEDFQPYATGGHWAYSDYGWTWESDYAWGWAPFHYGRWALTPSWGWVWYPGSVWAPAWVDWRFGGGYIGWAPLPPVGFAVVVQPWRPYWCFVPSNAFVYSDVWAYRLPVDRIHAAYAATVPVHSAVSYGRARWYAGPAPAAIEHAVGRPVPRVSSFTPPAPGRVQPVLPGGRVGAPIAPRATAPGGFGRPAVPASPAPGSFGRPASPAPAPGFRSGTPAPSPWRGTSPGIPSAPPGPRAPTPQAPAARPRPLGMTAPEWRGGSPSVSGVPAPRAFTSNGGFSSPGAGSWSAPRAFTPPPRTFSAPSAPRPSGAPGGYAMPSMPRSIPGPSTFPSSAPRSFSPPAMSAPRSFSAPAPHAGGFSGGGGGFHGGAPSGGAGHVSSGGGGHIGRR